MTLARRPVSIALTALFAAGCMGTPTAPTGAGKRRADASPAASASAVPVHPVASTVPPPSPSPHGPLASTVPVVVPSAATSPPLVDLASATLVGKIKAPASLLANNGAGLVSDHGGAIIANNGGGIVANNGGGIIANNGGGYRLMQAATAPEQFFVPGAKVEVLDANGQPVNGPDGKPLVTTSLADGTFAFSAKLPGRHVVLRATPPGGTGALTRLVANDVHAADVDLPSSVVADYVLDQYVRTQPDPQATLDKLPAPVEADTVKLAATALLAGKAPGSLAPGDVVAAAGALRQSSSAFDTQMEVVKKILIAAGVSNLGAGLKATEVYFRRLFASDAAADGTLYAVSSDDFLVWRVGADGTVTPVAGTGSGPTGTEPVSRAGRKASEVNLDYIWALQVDGQGRPIMTENNHGIWRVEPDGTITELFSQDALKAAFGSSFVNAGAYLRADGTLVTLVNDAIWSLAKDGTKTKLVDAPGMRASMGLVELADGKTWRGRFFEQVTDVSVGGAPKTVVADQDPRLAVSANGARNDPSMDVLGDVFYVAAADNQLHELKPDGTDTALLPRTSLRYGLAWALQGHDGKVYVSDCDMGDNLGAAIVRRVEAGGASTVVAGIDGLPKGFTSDGRFPLLYPKGLDVAPDGTLWVADAGALLKLAPGGTPELVAARGTDLNGQKLDFSGVRRLASGKLMARAVSSGQELIVQQTDTGWQTVIGLTKVYGNPWNIAMHAWDVKPDGTVVCSNHQPVPNSADSIVSVLRKAPGDLFQQTLVPTSAGFAEIAKLVYAPDGTLWMRARKAGTFTHGLYKVAEDGTVTDAPANALADEAADASGRLYEGDAPTFVLGNFGDRHIRRHPPGGPPEIIAGSGTSLLGGTTLDDSIGWAEDLRFNSAGNLYVRDVLRRQVRRIPKERL